MSTLGWRKKICTQGHDLAVAGRRKHGGCATCSRTRVREYMFSHPEIRWRRYGIRLSLPEFQRMAEAQGGLCVICEQETKLVPDHDHASGEVRALLCSSCNRAIGLLADSPERLNRAAEYLDNYRSPISGR